MLALAVPATSRGQTERSWNDGNPSFTQTVPVGDNIQLGNDIRLRANHQVSGADDPLDVLLYGLNWSWPSTIEIISTRDIDYRLVNNRLAYLVTDTGARRIYEYNASSGEIIWEFGSEIPTDPNYLERPVDAFIYKESSNGDELFKVLITDEGRNRVIKVDKELRIVDWYYGDPNDKAGSGPQELNAPADAVRLEGSQEILIADRGNNRILIVDEASKTIVWQFESTELNAPVDVDFDAATNDILITDQSNHQVLRVNRDDQNIVWRFGITGVPAADTTGLDSPTDADFLDNGHILITDAGNNRIIELDENNNITWQFSRPLKALHDTDRLPDGRHLVINGVAPSAIGYSDSLIALQEYDLGENREVIFDRISWEADTLDGVTSVGFQIRTANSLGDLRSADWMGPTGKNSFYTVNNQTINPIHTGHRLYQVRAFLQTNNPLYTPVLTKVQLDYHYYNIEETAVVRSITLPDDNEAYIPKWKSMTLNTQLPQDPGDRDAIRLEIFIKNAATDEIVANFTASQTLPETFQPLDNFTGLNNAQSIYIEAWATTSRPYVTPILEDWSITWDAIQTSTSALRFVNRLGNEVDYYRATSTFPAQENKVDSVRVIFSDPDLAAFQDAITLPLKSTLSGDSIGVTLELNSLTGTFSHRPIPILISESVDRQNGILEVFDRDQLILTYNDPDDPDDSSTDTVKVILNTQGSLSLEDRTGAPLTTISFGDTLFIRVSDDQDRNLSADAQETIQVSVFDNATGDEEMITLYEVSDGTGGWNSGTFVSMTGLPIEKNNNGVRNDGAIQTLEGHRVTAEYSDNVVLRRSVLIPQVTPPIPNPNIDFAGEVFVVQVAPNPYNAQKFTNFKLRIAGAYGTINLRKLEIFNLFGEKVREIQGSQLQFDQLLPVPAKTYAIAENWWDLNNEHGQSVSSGTYFVKAHANLANPETNTVESVALIEKFVIVR